MAEAGRSAWQPLFAGAAQGYDYFSACENAAPDSFEFYAAGVLDGDDLVAGTPMFRVDFRLDMLMDGPLQHIGRWLRRSVPRLTTIPIVGAGSPHADDISIVFSPKLDDTRRAKVLEVLLTGLHRHARDTGAQVVFVKSILDSTCLWAGSHFASQGYARIASLPIARLQLPSSPEAYIDSLSANMRSNIRRKLKKARALRLEVRDEISDLKQDINALRDATRSRSKTDYDAFAELSPDYFERVLTQLPGRARMLTYWKDQTLIGFAMALLEPDRIVERYSGLRYPEAIDTGAFFLNWMTMVRLGIEHGAKEYNAGETTYLTKARLGCRFERAWIYLRHRRGFMNPVLGAMSPLLAFDRTDPDLKLLGKSAPYLDPAPPTARTSA